MLIEGGHDVEVMCPAGPGEPPGTFLENGARVTRLRPLIRHGKSALVAGIGRDVKRFDAVYVHYPFFGGAEIGVLAAHLRHVPYLAYFHMDVVGAGAKGAFLGAYSRFVAPRILGGAKRVFVSSLDYVRASSIAGYGLRTMEELPYSVDESVYTPRAVDRAALQRHGIAPDESVILFVGAMDEGHRFKGIPELIQAYTRVGPSPHRLVLVGDGSLRPAYERLAQQAAPDRVTFLGRVDESLLVDLYRTASATVLPSVTQEEAFGVVLIESMSCGTPVIASNLPGVRSVFRDGEEGLLVPAGDVAALAGALDRMTRDEGLRQKLADGALAGARDRYARSREKSALLGAFSSLPSR